jgi:hypothetical protein
VIVTVEPSRFALTSTPSMRPSSTELTCPVNAARGAVAAPVKPAAVKNTVSAAIATTTTRKVFFIVAILRQIDSRITLEMQP